LKKKKDDNFTMIQNTIKLDPKSKGFNTLSFPYLKTGIKEKKKQ